MFGVLNVELTIARAQSSEVPVDAATNRGAVVAVASMVTGVATTYGTDNRTFLLIVSELGIRLLI